MTHHRQQVRDAAKSALTGLATTGSRVFKSREYPISPQGGVEPNGILIYTTETASEPIAMGADPTIQHVTELILQPWSVGTGEVDDLIDGICAEIEIALLGTDNDLAGLVDRLHLMNTELSYSGEGDQPIAAAELTVPVQYTTKETDPETIL